ncbi:MAG: polysaccharide biosynthesis C-terminal domain-containing protein, partial [Lachnospiraceae bacterium]|nr:polysaccharide biosynthesis C-terminal domain-containing protein [Lachnospiraceae bacterium]
SVMKPLLQLMHTPEDIYEDAYTYITTICMGIVTMVFYNLFSSFLRAIGNSRMPLVFLIISAVMNIILDLVFILHYKMEVRGAALATNLSQGVSAILCAIYIFAKVDVLKPKRSHWHFHKESVKKQLNIGVPMALQFGITASGTMVMQTAINQFGSVAVTGFTAASKVQNLLTQGMMALGQTMAAYSGQNYGKFDLNRIHQGTKDAMKISVIYSVVIGIAGVLLLPHMMKLFFDTGTDITPYLPWAKPYYYLCAAAYIALCMIFIYRNTMQGCGYGFVAMTLGIMELAARLIAAVLSMYLHSYVLAAAADSIAWVMTGIFAFGLYLHLRKKMQRQMTD